ncbi:hypothetical protein HBA55_13300 [Pseudomaricurvus alkylphenolicus]|jgi:hypothetical protein|uniref:DUF1302 family protein n=1 Tax=Pseudomaricurvus alkylphenolicus TaxID=1306991 RepID=UPI0014212EB7|nr:DUF1302 family protein [Pseudomaricurvus alkylphenolicus]NIB40571.1 hypothetical protein [Pseudomaricurvus alkylphenolicus]
MKQLAGIAMLVLSSTAYAAEFSGILKSQTSYGLDSHELQQQEWLLDVEFNRELWDGELTLIGRLRWDSVDDLNHSDRPDNYSEIGKPITVSDSGEIQIRELYWEKTIGDLYLRLGKQQVVWGEADGLKLLDVINPQSFREFILDDFDDSRIPLWMANTEITIDNSGTLQLLLIPDTTANELPAQDSPYALTSPKLVPTGELPVIPIIKPVRAANSLSDGDFGIRYSDFRAGWDFSLNYLYHMVDTPVVKSRFENGQLLVEQTYRRSHLIGGSASTAINDWTLRIETALETDRYHRTRSSLPGIEKSDQWGTVIGLDWQGWTDQFISIQWFHTRILQHDSDMEAGNREDRVTFLWESNFYNETLNLEWLHLHSLTNGDGTIQTRATYNFESNIDVYVGADFFYGNKDDLFGQFDQTDRISLGLNWGF